MSSAPAPSTAASLVESDSYRPVSSLAVLSLILGAASVLAFVAVSARWVIPPTAVVLGIAALRQIKKAPQEWVGRGVALLGIGLAGACFVGSLSYEWVNEARFKRQSLQFAQRFLDKLRAGDVEAAYWLTIPPHYRKDMHDTPKEMLSPEWQQQYGMFYIQYKELADQLKAGQASVEFDEIEGLWSEGGADFVATVHKVHAPKGDGHMLVVVSKMSYTHSLFEKSWHVGNHNPNYTPHTFVLKTSHSEHEGHSH